MEFSKVFSMDRVLMELKQKQRSYRDVYYVSNSKDDFFRAVTTYKCVFKYQHTNILTKNGMMRIDCPSVNRRNREQNMYEIGK